MEFLDALKNRRSIRAFSDKPVEQSTLDDILLEALESPSSSNTQPYMFAVATGDVTKKIGGHLFSNYQKISKIQNKPLLHDLSMHLAFEMWEHIYLRSLKKLLWVT